MERKVVYKGVDGLRIDKWLTNNFNYSRNFFQHLFEHKVIKVNGVLVKKSYKLKKGDIIEIENFDRFQSSEILNEAAWIDLKIYYQDNDYLVLWKPKGVLSHSNSIRDLSVPSVVAFLYQKFKNIPSIGNFIRAGIVHRLDKDTDGFMIIALSERGLQYFRDLFNQKSKAGEEGRDFQRLKKYYLATSLNQNNELLTEIKLNFPYKIEMLIKPKVPYYIPKLGISEITKIISIDGDFVTFEINLITGRTHQIRYQLSQLGFPIIGDKLYGDKKYFDYQMRLTAYKLMFYDLKGEKRTFEMTPDLKL